MGLLKGSSFGAEGVAEAGPGLGAGAGFFFSATGCGGAAAAFGAAAASAVLEGGAAGGALAAAAPDGFWAGVGFLAELLPAAGMLQGCDGRRNGARRTGERGRPRHSKKSSVRI